MLNFLGKVVVPPGTSRNNTNNTAAYLAGTGNYNATVAAYPASAADGAAGNLWTFAVTGDSIPGTMIPMPMVAPSFQPRLDFGGGQDWGWGAINLYVKPLMKP